MQNIGKIDREKFKDISQKIITDEVVLTEKQREHIKERHPEVLEKYENYLQEAVENPDYILKDSSREKTALLLKKLVPKSKKGKINCINLVLRLAVEEENIRNKNSIITCIPVGSNRLKSYINNGKIVYKNE